MPQLILNFTDSQTCPAGAVRRRAKRVVIEILARLLVQATGNQHQEQNERVILQNQTLAYAARRCTFTFANYTRPG